MPPTDFARIGGGLTGCIVELVLSGDAVNNNRKSKLTNHPKIIEGRLKLRFSGRSFVAIGVPLIVLAPPSNRSSAHGQRLYRLPLNKVAGDSDV
jgi:hypothetical protein